MAKMLEITVSIKDENGDVIITKTNKRSVPYIEEQGFRAAFHELETAVLESRKEVCDKTVSEYLEGMSQKNRNAAWRSNRPKALWHHK